LIGTETVVSDWKTISQEETDTFAKLTDDWALIHNDPGWPTVIVPATWTEDDLPIGVQIVARPWKEEVALKAAAYVEQVLGGWKAPPL
jgi:amidase